MTKRQHKRRPRNTRILDANRTGIQNPHSLHLLYITACAVQTQRRRARCESSFGIPPPLKKKKKKKKKKNLTSFLEP
jgi:hypothetical protein